MSSGTPDRCDLLAMERKYAFMVDAHTAHRARAPGPPRATFREVGQQFPGALKELERLPAAVLEDRLAAVRSALRGGQVPRWLALVHDYHHVLARTLLLVGRTASARGDALDDAIVARLSLRPRRPKLETIAVQLVAARAALSESAVIEALGFVGPPLRSGVGTVC